MAESTQSSIHILAAPATVLEIIADFEAYPAWAAQVQRAQVLAEDSDGWATRVQFHLDAGPLTDTYTLAYTWTLDQTGVGTVRWSLVEANLLKALDGSYTLASTDSGTTVEYRLSVAVGIPMVTALKRKAERIVIDAALTDLKKRAEA